ncbi:MAG: FAD:protein FMN transferase [Candidatus Omnitrophica bacterium]|nr:FAD:protein FMN transferase [Candidatus Omnitrophota bacterium]
MFLSIAVFLTGCGQMTFSKRQGLMMGTFVEIIVAGGTPSQRDQALEVAFQRLRELENKLNYFEAPGEIYRLNQTGYESVQQVSRETFHIVQTAKDFHNLSQGAFDVTVYPLMKLWGFFDDELNIPSVAAIESVMKQVGSDGILTDEDRSEIQFLRPGMGIDLGAIGKGFVCDDIVSVLKREGIMSALVNIGGTVFAFGKSPQGRLWRVGLRHPRDPSRTWKVVSLDHQAVSTSGDYENFFVRDGIRYAHILDPRTGYPARDSIAVSVIAPSAVLADFLSTTLFVLGPNDAPDMARQFPETHWFLTYFDEGNRFKTLSSSDLL